MKIDRTLFGISVFVLSFSVLCLISNLIGKSEYSEIHGAIGIIGLIVGCILISVSFENEN